MSAFLSFSQAMRPLIKAQHPKLSNTDISSVLAQKWNASSDESKRPFIEREIKDRLKYHENMAKWREEERSRQLQKVNPDQGDNQAMSTGMMESADDSHTNTSHDTASSIDCLHAKPPQFSFIGNPYPFAGISTSVAELSKHYQLNLQKNGHTEQDEPAISMAEILTASNNINIFNSSRFDERHLPLPHYPTLNQMSFFNAASSSSSSSSSPLISMQSPSSAAAVGLTSSSSSSSQNASAGQLNYFSFSPLGKTPLEKSRLKQSRESVPSERASPPPSAFTISRKSNEFVAPTSRPKKASANAAQEVETSRQRSHAITTVSAIYDRPLPPGRILLENASAETRSYYSMLQQHKDDSDYARTIRTLQMIRRLKMSGYSDDSDESYDSS
jgi:hypothetical protein